MNGLFTLQLEFHGVRCVEVTGSSSSDSTYWHGTGPASTEGRRGSRTVPARPRNIRRPGRGSRSMNSQVRPNRLEMGTHSQSGAKQPRLDRGQSEAKCLRYLSEGQARHGIEREYLPQGLRKPGNTIGESCSNLPAQCEFFRRQRRRRDPFRQAACIEAVQVDPRQPVLRPAKVHEALVHNDASEPRLERRVSPKAVQVAEGRQKGGLYGIAGLLFGAQNSIRQQQAR